MAGYIFKKYILNASVSFIYLKNYFLMNVFTVFFMIAAYSRADTAIRSGRISVNNPNVNYLQHS